MERLDGLIVRQWVAGERSFRHVGLLLSQMMAAATADSGLVLDLSAADLDDKTVDAADEASE